MRRIWGHMPRLFAQVGVVAALFALPVHASFAVTASPATNVKIAVLAFRGESEAFTKWRPTAEYLTQHIPGYVFQIVPTTLAEMKSAVEGERVDFILTNPGNYVEHEAFHGVTRIATLRSSSYQSAGNRFGAVIFSRRDAANIKTLRDLKGKRFMAIRESAFGGFQLAWREMKTQGLDPFADLATLKFVGFPHDRVVEAVLAGEVDAGTVRAGVLENLALNKKLDMADLRILNPQNEPGFPFALSTSLYPEWPFAQLKHTSEQLSQKVVIALLGMPKDHSAAVRGGYAGWTVPLDYQSVHDLFKELHIGPYGMPVEIRFSDLLEQYWHWGVFVVTLMGIAVLWGVRVEYLVTKRTAELSRANAELETQIVERKRAEDVASKRQNELAHVSRVNTMGELTASLAHEINQPLSAIANYATGSVRRLNSNTIKLTDLSDVMGTIATEAQRAGEVIRRIRTFVRKGEVSLTPLDLNTIAKEALEITSAEARRHDVFLHEDFAENLPAVIADKVQVEQVLLNLISNALDAVQSAETGTRSITITTSQDQSDEVICAVRDSGCGVEGDDPKRAGLGQEGYEQLFEPFYTTKLNGMGMGLSISRSIIEASGGRMWVEVGGQGGCVFKFSLPTIAINLPTSEETDVG